MVSSVERVGDTDAVQLEVAENVGQRDLSGDIGYLPTVLVRLFSWNRSNTVIVVSSSSMVTVR